MKHVAKSCADESDAVMMSLNGSSVVKAIGSKYEVVCEETVKKKPDVKEKKEYEGFPNDMDY